MSFLTVTVPGILQDPDSVRIERTLQTRIDQLIAALSRVMPDSIRFSDWLRFEERAFHIELQVDGPVHPHPVALAVFLCTGARRVHDRYFAAFRREEALKRLESDALWLDVNAAANAIEAVGGQIRFHADTPYEQTLSSVDPDFLRLARIWDETALHVDDALIVGLAVLPALSDVGTRTVLLSIGSGNRPFIATLPEHMLDVIRPGRTRASFEYVRDANDLCVLLEDTFVIPPLAGEPRSAAISSDATSMPNMDC